MSREWALLLAIAASATPSAAQGTPQTVTPTFQTGTRMVLVPVVVRDRDGHTVTNLTRENFQVFDKGKEQQIAAFSVERGGGVAAVPAQFIAYFFDDLSLRDFGSVMPLREAAIRQLANLRPDDRVAIFSSSCRLTQDFTDDRTKLQAVISKLTPDPVRICQVTPAVPLRIALLKAVVSRMAHLPGSKRIVMVSAGFAVAHEDQQMREELVDQAAEAKVAVDSLHIVWATGLQSGEAGPQRSGGDSTRTIMPQGYDSRGNDSQNLHLLADGTGGVVVEAGNSPDAGLQELATPDYVYALSFEPTEKADGSYHKLKVTVKDARKLTVRARAGYYSTAPISTPVTAEAPEKLVTAAEVLPAGVQPAREVPEIEMRNQMVAFRARTNLVQVPVVVRNRDGQIVGGLRKDDFQLSDNGQRQEITSLNEDKMGWATTEASAQSAALPSLAILAPAGSAGASPSKEPTVMPDRFTAYVFDDVHMRTVDLAEVREAVWQNIRESGPLERIAILTTSHRVSTDFTNDLETLRAALFRIQSMAMYRSVCTSCGDLSFSLGNRVANGDELALRIAKGLVITEGDSLLKSIGGALPSREGTEALARIMADRAVWKGEEETALSLGTIASVARRMFRLAGRRNIILLSHGFVVPKEQQGQLMQMVDSVLRSGVTIQTVNSAGLLTGFQTGGSPLDDDTVEPSRPSGSTAIRESEYQARLAGAETLRTIADSTGGTAIENSTDFLGAVRRLATPLEYRYILGFTPRDLAADGSFHKLTVKLTNSAYKSYTPQARRGYYAPKQDEGLPQAAEKEIEAAIFSRDDIRDVPVEMRTDLKDEELTVSADVDLKLLHFRVADGRNCEEVTAVAAVFDHDGNFISGERQTLTLKLRDETLAGLSQKPPETLRSSFTLSPGTYLVRLVVHSAEDQAMTEVSKLVDIP